LTISTLAFFTRFQYITGLRCVRDISEAYTTCGPILKTTCLYFAVYFLTTTVSNGFKKWPFYWRCVAEMKESG